jgi:hypothetical protein
MSFKWCFFLLVFLLTLVSCEGNGACECENISRAMENEINQAGEDIEKWENTIEHYKSSILNCEKSFTELDDQEKEKWLEEVVNCSY